MEAKVMEVIERAFKAWFLVVAVVAVFTLALLPWWCGILLVPFAVLTYFISIKLAITYLTINFPVEEMEEQPTEMQQTKGISGNVIGKFGDLPIYEWVEFNNPTTNQTERFIYCAPVRYNGSKMITPPDGDGKVYAIVDGIFYERDAST